MTCPPARCLSSPARSSHSQWQPQKPNLKNKGWPLWKPGHTSPMSHEGPENDLSLSCSTSSVTHVVDRFNYIFISILIPRNDSLILTAPVLKISTCLMSETDSFISPMTAYSSHMKNMIWTWITDVKNQCHRMEKPSKYHPVGQKWLQSCLIPLRVWVFSGYNVTTRPCSCSCHTPHPRTQTDTLLNTDPSEWHFSIYHQSDWTLNCTLWGGWK